MYIIIVVLLCGLAIAAPLKYNLLMLVIDYIIPDPIPVLDEALLTACVLVKAVRTLKAMAMFEKYKPLIIALAVLLLGGLAALICVTCNGMK